MSPPPSSTPAPQERAEALPLTALAGVGPVRARRLARLGVLTLGELVRLAPRRLERHAGLLPIAAARERVGEEVSVRGTLGPYRFWRRGARKSVLSARLDDGQAWIDAAWFGQPWMRDRLAELRRAGEPVALAGRVTRGAKGPVLASPRFVGGEELCGEGARERLVPVYPATAGLGQRLLRGLVAAARERVAPREELEPELLLRHDLPPLPEALAELHGPSSLAAHRRARRRLALERSIALEAERLLLRRGTLRARARRVVLDAAARARLWSAFPLEPTAAQRRVLDEVLDDLAREVPMRRLLQGDVGSGKTLVALAAALAVAEAGGQVALLAPTETLAEQHALGLAGQPVGERLGTVLLTGSTPRAERRRALAALEEGRARLAVGTHALLSPAVRFARLDLVVIDEEQRFGVAQRRALVRKERAVHALSTTATPIPRTLALALWSDLEHSRLDEKPPGRLPVRTELLPPSGRPEVVASLAARVAAGERGFWVTPRIEAEEDDGEAAAAERAFAELGRGPLGPHGIELVHGRLEAAERARRLARFRAGEVATLVATSVIEVGVDVPEASFLVVEGAERFGLAQLHQLRGRVGRGPRASRCLLLAAPESHARLSILAEEHDGFRIAEADLRQRGMGELDGLRQSGHPDETALGPLSDEELLDLARALVAERPALVHAHLERARRPAPP